MEQIRQGISLPIQGNHISLLKPPFYLWPVLLVVISLVTINLSVTGLAWMLAPDNPFAEFAEIFPGQPASTLPERGFSCDEQSYNAYSLFEQYCLWSSSTGVFSKVEAIVYKGDAIQQLNFTVQDKSLRVGHLAVWLEEPNYHIYQDAVYFQLPNQFIVAKTISSQGHISPQSPVKLIALTDNGISQEVHCSLLASRSVCASL